MSDIHNEVYLERVHEQFSQSEDGDERLRILAEMREVGFEEQAEHLEDAWWEERNKFATDLGLKPSEILMNEYGDEFVYVEDESGSPGLDYDVQVRKVMLPEHLDVMKYLDKQK